MPQLHARQLGPYLLAAHCAQTVPLALYPLGQLLTHVAFAMNNKSGDVHEVQFLEDVMQVAQLLLHAVQTREADAYVPEGHEDTQVLPER